MAMIKYIKKRKLYKIISFLIHNFINRLNFLFKIYHSTEGSTHYNISISESTSYINAVFNDYLIYSALEPKEIKGKEILEIGPGDNFGVALKFVCCGAKKVTCLDKFYSFRNHSQQYQIYSKLRQGMEDNHKKRFDTAVRLDGSSFELDKNKIEYIYGVGIENADRVFNGSGFDLIISRAVLEHISEIELAFYVMDKFLKRGGYLIHKVDLRDHGMFSKDGHDPLTFLTIPNFIWSNMTRYSGKPNRRRVDFYERKLQMLNYNFKIYITHLATQKEEIIPHKEQIIKDKDYHGEDLTAIAKMRNKLCKDFRNLSDENLLTAGIFFVAKKN